jgi:hypothetical protein
MSISLGLFDLFTYIVPGSLYLALVAYVADRLGWIGVGQFKDVPSLVLFGGIVIASYLLGFVAEPLAEQLDRRMRFWKARYQEDAREVFEASVPGAVHRAYVKADLYLLLAAAETSQKEVALEISRLRATGLMLRNCSVPFLGACIVSIAEAIAGTHLAAAVLCAVFFVAAVLSCLRQGKRLRGWANTKTLQICYWIPGIDDAVLGQARRGTAPAP